jgi:hypothetical protein
MDNQVPKYVTQERAALLLGIPEERDCRYLSGETARNWTSGQPNAPCRRACSLRGAIQRAPCS